MLGGDGSTQGPRKVAGAKGRAMSSAIKVRVKFDTIKARKIAKSYGKNLIAKRAEATKRIQRECFSVVRTKGAKTE